MSYKRKNKGWTNQELKRLEESWPIMSKDELLVALAPHPWGSIKTVAYQLGLRRPRGLGGYRNWKKIAADHIPVFNLPTDVQIPYKRPWS